MDGRFIGEYTILENNDMMAIFFQLLQMSLAGSFAVFYLLLLRVLLGKLPKKLTYVLWGLVGFHLIFTVVPIGRFAILPNVDIVQELWYVDVNWNVIVVFYLIGVIAILLMNVVHYFHLARLLRQNAKKKEGADNPFQKVRGFYVPVYYSSGIASAFTFGYFPPRIYLPEGIDASMEEMVVCHEMTHIRRGDYFTKLLAFVLCTLNWFNPLLWCAYYFFVRDQETSCDELVLQKIGIGQKKQYAEAILNAASGFFRSGERDHAMPFGEANIKYRIRRCVKAGNIERRKYVAMLLVTLGFFVLGIFVSSVFQIDRLPFMAAEQNGTIGVFSNAEEYREYQMRGDGIYQIDENGEKLIYRGSFLITDSFYWTNQGLFFMTQNAREIRCLNVDTYKWEKVFRCEKGREIASFVPSGGFLKIRYTDGSVECRKLYLKRQSTVSTQEILEHPGKVYNVTQWKKDGAYAWLDLDGDGKDEELLLDFSMEDMMSGGDWVYTFSVNNKSVIQKEISKISNEIYAVSLDGEHIYVALTDRKCPAGEETPETTTFYQYENGSLNSYGEIQAPISVMNFTDGIITVMMSEKIIFGETYQETWQVDADGRFVRMEKETDCVSLKTKVYDLQKDIEVHTEPGSKETFHVAAQRVEMHQVMKNQQWDVGGVTKKGYWVELTFPDGAKGWIFISDGQLENGERAEEVFCLAVFHHPITTTDGGMTEEK